MRAQIVSCPHGFGTVITSSRLDRVPPGQNRFSYELKGRLVTGDLTIFEDCQRAVDKWNRIIERSLGDAGAAHLLRLPHRRFHRLIGLYAMPTNYYDPDGCCIDAQSFSQARDRWLPSAADRAHIQSLMVPVLERGKIAGWLAPPARGIQGRSFDFEYVRP